MQYIIISTHTPHARRDTRNPVCNMVSTTFQLTRLMRGVTSVRLLFRQMHKFQLTRLMRGVTVLSEHPHARAIYFNSHASCEA